MLVIVDELPALFLRVEERVQRSDAPSCRGSVRLVLVRREKMVISHVTRLKARPRQLEVDPECLRWTPVIVTNTVVSDADGDDDDEEDEDAEEDNRKEVTPRS